MKKLAKLNSRPFEYMVYDGTNDEELKAFAGTVVAYNEHDSRRLIRDDEFRIYIVDPGMYVVKDENGKISVYTKKEFEQKFSSWSFMDDLPRTLLYSHRHCREDECFVMDYPHQMMATDKIPMKKKRSDLADADNYIRCVICHEPATQLDHLFPNDTMDNRCSKHAKSLIDPCAWEDYGTAVEVCKDHYGMLVLRAHIEKQLDWLMKQDMLLDENILRDKLLDTLRHLDYYMKAKWPKEQMGPKKEDRK